jgi:hypothetical protein
VEIKPPPAAPVDDTLSVSITSDPPGAVVSRAGNAVGSTPVEIKFKKGAPEFDVELKKEGYSTALRSIATDKSREITVSLAKEAAAPAAAAAHTPAPAASKHAKPPRSHGPGHAGQGDGLGGDDNKILAPTF